MLKTFARLLAIGAIAAPLAAQAVTFQFTANLNGVHAPAPVGINAGVIVSLTSPFLVLNQGGSLLIGAAGVAPPTTSFLSQLQSGLAYVNIHTAAKPGGEIRGQLFQVALCPNQKPTRCCWLVWA